MTGIRWWRLLSLVAVAVMWWGCSPAQAQQNHRSECREDQLKNSKVDATIRFNPHETEYVRVDSEMTIHASMKEWNPAKYLAFSAKSPEYRTAMRCLLRGQDHQPRLQEWRSHDPGVTIKNDTVTVEYKSFNWIKSRAPLQIGPWKIQMSQAGTWQVHLWSPTLEGIHWRSVTAELKDLKYDVQSEDSPSIENHSLTWSNQLPRDIWFDVELPWQRTWILNYDQSTWQLVGVAAWWVCASIVIALAAFRTQRAYVSPMLSKRGPRWRVGFIGDPPGESPVRPILQWALFSGAVALMLMLIIKSRLFEPRWRALVCIPAGLTLVLVARPWSRGVESQAPDIRADEATGPDPTQRRQARAVIVTASTVAAIGLLVVLSPGLFGLSQHLKPRESITLGRTGLTLKGLATVWLWLAAMVAWAWRFAREGGLVRASWAHRYDKAPVRWTATVAMLLGSAAGALFVCILKYSERQWHRLTWLTEQNSATDQQHADYVNDNLLNFAFTDLLWIFSCSWFLTGIALISLLHFRVKAQHTRAGHKQEQLSLGPNEPELALTVVIFAFTAGLRGATFVGFNAQYGIWFLLNICSLTLVLAVGRKWSVLNQLGQSFYAQRLDTHEHREELKTKAHQYRNLNHQAYQLDHGRATGITNYQLENRLHKLRQWLVDGCGPKKIPPNQISVLDAALAWGPEDHWWSNALHAARLAFWFGLPASASLVYLNVHGSSNWAAILYEPVAIPDAVAHAVYYQVAWTGAGFTLGALWRLLPGRRGPVRAWNLTIAYALPAGVVLLIIRLIDFIRLADWGAKSLLLFSLLMVIILTLTGIWMDTSTLSEDRQFWPSRLTLLLSIYQVRGFSGQIALLITQVGAVVAIYRNLVPK